MADSFDAMTTDRPYKRRRVSEDVIEDLQRCTGKQFAPELVMAFCRAMLKELTNEKKEKQFRRLLGREYLEADKIVPLLKNILNNTKPTSSLTFILS